jgi:hypothetical protein
MEHFTEGLFYNEMKKKKKIISSWFILWRLETSRVLTDPNEACGFVCP